MDIISALNFLQYEDDDNDDQEYYKRYLSNDCIIIKINDSRIGINYFDYLSSYNILNILAKDSIPGENNLVYEINDMYIVVGKDKLINNDVLDMVSYILNILNEDKSDDCNSYLIHDLYLAEQLIKDEKKLINAQYKSEKYNTDITKETDDVEYIKDMREVINEKYRTNPLMYNFILLYIYNSFPDEEAPNMETIISEPNDNDSYLDIFKLYLKYLEINGKIIKINETLDIKNITILITDKDQQVYSHKERLLYLLNKKDKLAEPESEELILLLDIPDIKNIRDISNEIVEEVRSEFKNYSANTYSFTFIDNTQIIPDSILTNITSIDDFEISIHSTSKLVDNPLDSINKNNIKSTYKYSYLLNRQITCIYYNIFYELYLNKLRIQPELISTEEFNTFLTNNLNLFLSELNSNDITKIYKYYRYIDYFLKSDLYTFCIDTFICIPKSHKFSLSITQPKPLLLEDIDSSKTNSITIPKFINIDIWYDIQLHNINTKDNMFNKKNINLTDKDKTQIDNILLKLYGINTEKIHSKLNTLYNEYHICLKNKSESKLVLHDTNMKIYSIYSRPVNKMLNITKDKIIHQRNMDMLYIDPFYLNLSFKQHLIITNHIVTDLDPIELDLSYFTTNINYKFSLEIYSLYRQFIINKINDISDNNYIFSNAKKWFINLFGKLFSNNSKIKSKYDIELLLPKYISKLTSVEESKEDNNHPNVNEETDDNIDKNYIVNLFNKNLTIIMHLLSEDTLFIINKETDFNIMFSNIINNTLINYKNVTQYIYETDNVFIYEDVYKLYKILIDKKDKNDIQEYFKSILNVNTNWITSNIYTAEAEPLTDKTTSDPATILFLSKFGYNNNDTNNFLIKQNAPGTNTYLINKQFKTIIKITNDKCYIIKNKTPVLINFEYTQSIYNLPFIFPYYRYNIDGIEYVDVIISSKFYDNDFIKKKGISSIYKLCTFKVLPSELFLNYQDNMDDYSSIIDLYSNGFINNIKVNINERFNTVETLVYINRLDFINIIESLFTIKPNVNFYIYDKMKLDKDAKSAPDIKYTPGDNILVNSLIIMIINLIKEYVTKYNTGKSDWEKQEYYKKLISISGFIKYINTKDIIIYNYEILYMLSNNYIFNTEQLGKYIKIRNTMIGHDPKDNSILYQLSMGKGKTSVLTPLLAFTSTIIKDKPAVIMTTTHLKKPTENYIKFISKLYDLNIEILNDYEMKEKWLYDKLYKITSNSNINYNLIIDEFDYHHNYLKSMFNYVIDKEELITKDIYNYIFSRLISEYNIDGTSVIFTTSYNNPILDDTIKKNYKIIQSSKFNDTYGFDKEEYGKKYRLCIPFDRKDTPIKNSNFSDIILSIMYTLDFHIKKAIKDTTNGSILVESSDISNMLNYKDIIKYLDNNDIKKVADLYNRDDNDAVRYTEITEYLKFAKEYVYICNKDKIKIAKQQLNMSFQDIIHNANKMWQVGYTGTVYLNLNGIDSYSKDIVMDEFNKDETKIQTDKYELDNIYKQFGSDIIDTDNILVDIINYNPERKSPDPLVALLRTLKVNRGIVDLAGYYLNTPNKEVATIINGSGYKTKNNVYFNNETAMVGVDDPTKYDVGKDEYFYIFDKTHILGTDLKNQPRTGCACILINYETKESEFLQAVYRFRNINKGTYIKIIYVWTSHKKDIPRLFKITLEDTVKSNLVKTIFKDIDGLSGFNFKIQKDCKKFVDEKQIFALKEDYFNSKKFNINEIKDLIRINESNYNKDQEVGIKYQILKASKREISKNYLESNLCPSYFYKTVDVRYEDYLKGNIVCEKLTSDELKIFTDGINKSTISISKESEKLSEMESEKTVENKLDIELLSHLKVRNAIFNETGFLVFDCECNICKINKSVELFKENYKIKKKQVRISFNLLSLYVNKSNQSIDSKFDRIDNSNYRLCFVEFTDFILIEIEYIAIMFYQNITDINIYDFMGNCLNNTTIQIRLEQIYITILGLDKYILGLRSKSLNTDLNNINKIALFLLSNYIILAGIYRIEVINENYITLLKQDISKLLIKPIEVCNKTIVVPISQPITEILSLTGKLNTDKLFNNITRFNKVNLDFANVPLKEISKDIYNNYVKLNKIYCKNLIKNYYTTNSINVNYKYEVCHNDTNLMNIGFILNSIIGNLYSRQCIIDIYSKFVSNLSNTKCDWGNRGESSVNIYNLIYSYAIVFKICVKLIVDKHERQDNGISKSVKKYYIINEDNSFNKNYPISVYILPRIIIDSKIFENKCF